MGSRAGTGIRRTAGRRNNRQRASSEADPVRSHTRLPKPCCNLQDRVLAKTLTQRAQSDTSCPGILGVRPISEALSPTWLAGLACPHQATTPAGCLIPGRGRSACREGPTVVSLGGQKQAAGMAEGPALGPPGTQPRVEEEDSQAAQQSCWGSVRTLLRGTMEVSSGLPDRRPHCHCSETAPQDSPGGAAPGK